MHDVKNLVKGAPVPGVVREWNVSGASCDPPTLAMAASGARKRDGAAELEAGRSLPSLALDISRNESVTCPYRSA
jgi:hypothetical protein